MTKTFNFIKCEQPSHPENDTISGYDFPALEISQISLSCPPGYGFPHREVTSTCTNEAMWSPDLSQLECQRDCGQLPSKKDVYTILRDNYNTITGSIILFECVQTHLITDLSKTFHQAECLESGLWQPDPENTCTCGHTSTTVNVGYGEEKTVVSLGAVIVLLCLALLGTSSALFTIIIKYYKYRKGRDNRMNYTTQDQATEVIAGSGVLTPNACYEPIKISQKPRVVPDDGVEIERNPAYATLSPASR